MHLKLSVLITPYNKSLISLPHKKGSLNAIIPVERVVDV